ncbi:MAG: PDZ domain-containing protein, partial [Acidimicrobiales bacterium]|nr:PDZ domain-containing protein [Acidimicrobiales bacterium]
PSSAGWNRRRTPESTGVLEIRVRRGNRWQTASATVFPADRSYVVATGRIVDGADEIFVVVRRSDPRPAEIVGTDDHADIAVLEVGGEVGGSMRWSTPRLGSSVAVIGAPNGGEAATGTVRAIDVRESTSTGAAIDGMLLTDVQSEAELSGGAVVDDAGDVVGLVNALPFAASGHAPGTPAVRADVVALIAEQIITDGSARHAWLGVDVAEMSRPDEARGRGGVMVAAVEPRGPAATAGIAQGDWILAVEDSQVTSIPSLMAALRQRQPGDVVSLLVGRDRLERITVRLGTGPPEE